METMKSAQSHPIASLHAKKVIWLAHQMKKQEKKAMKVGGKMTLREIYNALTSIIIKKDLTTSHGLYPPKNERKLNGSDSSEEKFGDIVIVGTGGEKDTSYKKKVQKLRQLIAMRVARKKRVEELMAKREGTFLQKRGC
jgi:hypothetical protein